MNKKLLLSFALAAAMTGCINDADVPSGNGDNPATVPLPPKTPEFTKTEPPKNTR